MAINDYTGNHETPAEAEYRFSQDQWKFQHVHALASPPSSLSPFLGDYRAVALFDDDIRVSTADLNRLFAVGDVFKLRLWQPALGEGSRATWPVTRRADGSLIRMTDFVEIIARSSAAKGCDLPADVHRKRFRLVARYGSVAGPPEPAGHGDRGCRPHGPLSADRQRRPAVGQRQDAVGRGPGC